jgi:hypothetical protein
MDLAKSVTDRRYPKYAVDAVLHLQRSELLGIRPEPWAAQNLDRFQRQEATREWSADKHRSHRAAYMRTYRTSLRKKAHEPVNQLDKDFVW